MDGKDSVQLIGAPMTKRTFRPSLLQPVCNFCRKPGHFQRNYQMAKGLCLACGSGDHKKKDCSHRRIRNPTPVQLTLPALPAMRDSGRKLTPSPAVDFLSGTKRTKN